MRILTVNVHYSPESYGGATVVAEQLTRHFSANGHEAIALTGATQAGTKPGEFYRYEDAGLPVLALGRRLPQSTNDEYHQAELAQRFDMALEAIQPDVVHFHAVQGLGVEMVQRAQAAGAATAVTLHDAWWLCERQFMVRADGTWCAQQAIDPGVCDTCVPDPIGHRRRQQTSLEILNNCDRVLTPSQYWYELMHGSGISESVLRVNRNGVLHPDPSFQRTPHRGPVRFAYVGGDQSVKGVNQLRQALAGIRRSDYQLLLVDPSLKIGHRSMFERDFPCSGQIMIARGYEYRDLDYFFNSVDVLLFPSQWCESYGLTVREAILRGSWVVATAGGGASEDLVDGVNATIIPLDGRGDGLRDAMQAILEDPDRYRDAARPVRPIPTFAEQAAELEGIYREMLNLPSHKEPLHG